MTGVDCRHQIKSGAFCDHRVRLMNTSSSQSLLATCVVAPRDILLDTPQAQRLSLFFDSLALVHTDKRFLQLPELRQLDDELEFLVSTGLVVRIGSRSAFPFGIMSMIADGGRAELAGAISSRFEIEVPFDLAGNFSAWQPGEADNVMRKISQNMTYDGRPISTAYRTDKIQEVPGKLASAIEVAVSNVPLPSAGMPWQDFLEFRADPEHRAHLQRLRTWLQARALANTPSEHVGDELETLLQNYRDYMRVQHIKYGEGTISTIIVCALDAFENLLNFKVGTALRSLVDIRAKRIALTEAELLAPGREVSYLIHANSAVAS